MVNKPLSDNPKDVASAGKVRVGLWPMVATLWGARVLQDSAEGDYGAWNWRATEISLVGHAEAIKRHVDAILDGEYLDPKSGRPHLAHILATAGLMLDASELGNLKMDTPPPGRGPGLLMELNAGLDLRAVEVPGTFPWRGATDQPPKFGEVVLPATAIDSDGSDAQYGPADPDPDGEWGGEDADIDEFLDGKAKPGSS